MSGFCTLLASASMIPRVKPPAPPTFLFGCTVTDGPESPFGVERSSIIHNMEMEVGVHHLIAFQNPTLDEFDIRYDELLLTKRRGSKRELHWPHVRFIHLRIVIPIPKKTEPIGDDFETQQFGIFVIELKFDRLELLRRNPLSPSLIRLGFASVSLISMKETSQSPHNSRCTCTLSTTV